MCKKLGLKPAPVSTQIVQRDRHAEFFTTLAIIAGSIDKFATEIRHLQRTEVLEAEEFFSKGQKGSSAMPHKRNPIVSEQMCGLARVLRANSIAAMENIALWHERDISHSSVERIILPDSTTLMDYMLNKMIFLMKNLYVYPDNMMKNINLTNGLIFSQEVLIALIKEGLKREDAYEIVQKNAMKAWDEKKYFYDVLKTDNKLLKYLSKEELKNILEIDTNNSKIDWIFKNKIK